MVYVGVVVGNAGVVQHYVVFRQPPDRYRGGVQLWPLDEVPAPFSRRVAENVENDEIRADVVVKPQFSGEFLGNFLPQTSQDSFSRLR